MTESRLPPCGRDASDAERLQLLIDSVKDYALVTFDTGNRIVSWNAGAERLLGYNEGEIVGQLGSIFFTPEDQANGEVERELHTAAREGRSEDERWHVRKDGSRFWGSGAMYPLRDDPGRTRGYGKIFRDDTLRREMEHALKSQEEQFRLVVENVREYALFHLGPDGRVSGWNPGASRIFGYEPHEIVGEPVHRLFTPEDVESGYVDNELRRTLTQGGVEEARWVVAKGGTRFFARWITNPILDETGQLRGFVKVLQDETERKREQEERSAADAQRQALLESEVAIRTEALDRTKNELRRLAASLLTAQEDERRRIARELHDDFSQRLAGLDIRVTDVRKELPEDAIAAKKRLEELRDDIRLLSTDVRSLSHRLHPSVLDDLGLAVALRTLVKDWEGVLVFRITENVPEDIPREVSYAIYRIAQEALRNVQKHARGTSVTVTLSMTSGRLRLVIEDRGPGFDLGDRAADRGLGLVSMQERALLVAGQLVIDSKIGRGTRIDVQVPLVENV